MYKRKSSIRRICIMHTVSMYPFLLSQSDEPTNAVKKVSSSTKLNRKEDDSVTWDTAYIRITLIYGQIEATSDHTGCPPTVSLSHSAKSYGQAQNAHDSNRARFPLTFPPTDSPYLYSLSFLFEIVFFTLSNIMVLYLSAKSKRWLCIKIETVHNVQGNRSFSLSILLFVFV